MGFWERIGGSIKSGLSAVKDPRKTKCIAKCNFLTNAVGKNDFDWGGDYCTKKLNVSECKSKKNKTRQKCNNKMRNKIANCGSQYMSSKNKREYENAINNCRLSSSYIRRCKQNNVGDFNFYNGCIQKAKFSKIPFSYNDSCAINGFGTEPRNLPKLKDSSLIPNTWNNSSIGLSIQNQQGKSIINKKKENINNYPNIVSNQLDNATMVTEDEQQNYFEGFEVNLEESKNSYIQSQKISREINKKRDNYKKSTLDMAKLQTAVMGSTDAEEEINSRLSALHEEMQNNLKNITDQQMKQLKTAISYYEYQLKMIKLNKKMIHSMKYTKTFNDDYSDVQKLNKEINEKERIIKINNDEFERKNTIANILISAIIISLIVSIVCMLYFIKAINGQVLSFVLVGGFLIGLFMILYNTFSNHNSKIANATKKEFNNALRSGLRYALPEVIEKCPTDCKKKPDTSKFPEVDMAGNELTTDNARNVWKDGDYTYIKGTPDELDNEYEVLNPKPYYSGLKNPDKYNLEWKGNPDGQIAFDHGTKFSSTVPSQFWAGYKTDT